MLPCPGYPKKNVVVYTVIPSPAGSEISPFLAEPGSLRVLEMIFLAKVQSRSATTTCLGYLVMMTLSVLSRSCPSALRN